MTSLQTHLERSEYLSSLTNCSVYCQLEWFGPTGSWKDRVAERIVQEALDSGFRKLVVISSGNYGLAIAHAARDMDLSVFVLGYSDLLPWYRNTIESLGASVILFEGTEALNEELLRYSPREYFFATLPYEALGERDTPGIQGYGAISQEIVAVLGKAPDFLVMPTCNADGAKGMLRAYERMKAEGKITKFPRFVLACARETDGDIAYSISIDRPATPQVEYVLEKTSGISLFITDAQFLRGQEMLSKKCGFDVEISCGGVAIGLEYLAQAKLLPPETVVVAMFTARRRESLVR